MFALEHKTGLGSMVEAFAIEPDQPEVLPIMLHMTANTVGLSGRTAVGTGVVPGLAFQAMLNLDVALQAFEPACMRAEIVTSGTLGNSLQLLMRP